MTGWLLALLAAAGYAAGTLLQASGARGAPGLKAVVSPRVIAGFTMDGLAWLATLAALRRLPVFAVQSIHSAQLIGVVFGAWWLFKLRPRRLDVAATVGVVIALTLVAASAGPQPAVVASGLVTGTLVASVLLTIGFVALWRRLDDRWLTVVAGLGYSLTALAARGAEASGGGVLGFLLQPLIVPLALGGVVGTVAYVLAVGKGRPGMVVAVSSVIEVIVPGALGLALLGDVIRPGWQVAAGAGVVLCLAGCVAMATGPAGALED